MTRSRSCSYPLGTHQTTTTSGGRCCTTTTSDSSSRPAVRTAGRDELSEVVVVQHRPPLVVVVWCVPRGYEHDRDLVIPSRLADGRLFVLRCLECELPNSRTPCFSGQ